MTAMTTPLVRRIRPARDSEAPGAFRASEYEVSFTVIAVATAFLLLFMPSSRLDYEEISIAAAVAAALISLTLLGRLVPGFATLVVPIGFIGLAALLRDGAGGSASGFGGLLLLPVLWVALTAGTRELGLIIGAMLVAQLVPLLALGPPAYPASGWRSVVVLTSVGAITGVMVQRLVGETRRRADLLSEQATSLERISTQLAEHNEHLLEIDRMKDEFIAVVSHELRTPLTSISGYLEMALETAEESVAPAQQRYLSIVQRNVKRLNALVNQLLFLARADSRMLELDLCPLDLAEVVQEASETAKPGADAKDITLQVDTEQIPPVLADEVELLRLLDNLVSNAVKFTPPHGHVHLSARRDGETAVVAVADTGIGIPPDELPDLFKRFFRASSATDNAIPGTGLGLAISQVIAKAHGTEIEVETTLGKGTTLRFALPLAQLEEDGNELSPNAFAASASPKES